MRELESSFLQLMRLGIGHAEPSTGSGFNTEITGNVDWVAVKSLADKQGLSAVILDGIEVFRTNDNHNDIENLPNQMALLGWIGEVMQNYEARYKQYEKAIDELAKFYQEHAIKMMVLKGYACSLDWPKPKHRPCGDIDIWLFGQQRDADAAIEDFKVQDSSASEAAKPSASFKIDTSHHHHTVFNWKGFTVENHYDFVNVHAHKSSAELEKIFKELGQDDTHIVEIKGAKVYLPSPNLHALFLIKHMVSHFAAAEITLRQVLDWAFFVEKHTKEVDWKWLLEVLEKFHMKEFFNLSSMQYV